MPPKTRSKTAPQRLPAAPAAATATFAAVASAAPGPAPPSATKTTPDSLKTLRTEITAAASVRNKNAKAKNTSWNHLYNLVQEMAQADAINVDSMHLLLSTCRAAIKHTEAGPHAPPFPPELIDGLNSYVVKAPKASFKGLGTHLTAPSAAETANATRTDTHSNPSPPARGAPITTRTALPDSLQDWRVVGMGRGSSRAAATAEGLKDFRLFARYDSNHPTLNLDPSVQRDLANSTLDTALAPPGARIGVVDKVSSGLALTPTGGCTVEELEPHFARIAAALGATRVERNENWHRWVLRDIPTFIDNKLVDENDLRAEIIARLRIVDPDRPHSLVGNVSFVSRPRCSSSTTTPSPSVQMTESVVTQEPSVVRAAMEAELLAVDAIARFKFDDG
ncbi:unnamed protein product, partial [Tilletia caries]